MTVPTLQEETKGWEGERKRPMSYTKSGDWNQQSLELFPSIIQLPCEASPLGTSAEPGVGGGIFPAFPFLVPALEQPVPSFSLQVT